MRFLLPLLMACDIFIPTDAPPDEEADADADADADGDADSDADADTDTTANDWDELVGPGDPTGGPPEVLEEGDEWFEVPCVPDPDQDGETPTSFWLIVRSSTAYDAVAYHLYPDEEWRQGYGGCEDTSIYCTSYVFVGEAPECRGWELHPGEAGDDAGP